MKESLTYRMEWSGSTDTIKEWAESIGHMANRQFISQVQDLAAREAVRLIKAGFDKEMDPNGKKWKDLSDHTAMTRARKGYGPYHPILMRSGSLKNSIRHVMTRDGFRIVSDNEYIHFHQFGTRTPAKKGPVLYKPKGYKRRIRRNAPRGAAESRMPARKIFPDKSGDLAAGGDTSEVTAFQYLMEVALNRVADKMGLAHFAENTGSVFQWVPGGTMVRQGNH